MTAKKTTNLRLSAYNSRAVMLSKRSNVFYLERARILQVKDKVVYLTDSGLDVEQMFNIPDKNTAFLLLGKGTSITDSAVRKLAESNVIIGFCGSGGSPLFGALDLTFLAPQDEYRPTQYLQAWLTKWLDEPSRIQMARIFLELRIRWTELRWMELGLTVPGDLMARFRAGIAAKTTAMDLLLAEATWAKALYAVLAREFDVPFSRDEGKRASSTLEDRINGFLDHGNYLTYGYAAVALHGLGISFAFPVLHGKTRRGGLVFDVADLIKDGLVMPLAFIHGRKGSRETIFRAAIIEKAQDVQALDFLMQSLAAIALDPTPSLPLKLKVR